MEPLETKKDKLVVRMSNFPHVIHLVRPPGIKAVMLGMLSSL